ncbi:hypothetical protein Rwratislav_41365 [Rhodococcus wratislaviensis IFP 2016]|nr:hypothetical protein Rwratislav_41365 [Rhodococcus wratislaviensis IFP 2016]
MSLWQALEARKKSAQDSLAAEERSRVEAERHAEQLNAANARLENELNAQRQYQQLQSIPPIWDAIGDLTVPTNNLLQTLQRARVDEDTKSIAKAELLAWRPIAFKAAISFSSAFLLINEENTMASIRKTQSALEMLVKAVERLHSDISAGEPVTARSIGEASKLQNELVANRKEMIETAKQHIGGYNGIPSTQTNPDPGS